MEFAHCSSEDFFDEMRKHLDRGGGFVPLVGAGISVASGIATGRAIRSLLADCLLRAALSWRKADVDDLWNPRIDPWPSTSVIHEWAARASKEGPFAIGLTQLYRRLRVAGEKTLDAERVLGELATRAWEKESREGDGRWDLTIEEDARNLFAGATADWRMALNLLSRIEVRRVGKAGEAMRTLNKVTAENAAVIDSFFLHLTEGRQPSLAHQMLAVLAEVLRVSVVLTTNFDDLIERAFEALRKPLAVFDVHKLAGLPTSALVLQKRCLVKLHGGRYGLRADTSLDDVPGTTDLENFTAYLAATGRAESSAEAGTGRLPCANAILVAGVSGQDERILRFIQHAARQLSGLKVFWLCHNPRDLVALEESLRCFLRVSGGGTVHTAFSVDAGLSLFELFQHLTGTIPASGCAVPFGWHIPLPSHSPDDGARSLRGLVPVKDGGQHDSETSLGRAKLISDHFSRWWRRTDASIAHHGERGFPKAYENLVKVVNLANLDARLFQVHRAEDDWGAADIMSRFFYSLPPEMNKLWLNLDTTGKPVAVCNRILLAMLRIAGLPETTQASESEHLENKDFDGDEWREMAQRTARQAALRRSGPWCIFLNAWDEPGKSPLIVPTGKRDGWKSVKRIKQLAGFLTALTSAPRAADGGQTMPAVGIVLMIGAVHPLAKALRIEASQTTFVPQQEEHLATTKTITEKVKQWLERPNDDFGLEKSTRPLLLQLIMRIQAPRYRAGLHRILYHLLRERFGDESESSNPSLPRLLTAKIDYDIGVLETCRLFKRKPGGFLWMHTSLRDSRELRKLLVRPENPGVVDLERFIARWYGRVLLASSEPLPAFLSVRHALEALKIFGELSEKKLLSPEEDRRLQPALGTTVRHAAIILRLNRCIIESKMAPLLARRFVESACERIREVQKVVAGKVECAAALDHLDAEHITLLQRLLEVQGDYRSAIHPPQASAPSPARRSSPSSPEGWSRAQSADAERYLIEGLGWMNLRCYGRARSAFHKVLVELTAGSAIPLLQTRHRSLPDLDLRQLWQGAWDWLKRYGADRRRTSLLIRCLRRVTYLLIHEAHVDWMIVGTHRAAPDSEVMRRCIALLDAAAKYAELGLELLRGLDPEDDFLIYYENARLRIHLAFARARAASWRDITPEERRAQMDFAEELLIDAQAYLDEWPLGGDTLTTAVLELRRAEIKLMRFWNGSTANGTDEFRELRMKLWRGRGEIDFGLIWPGFSLRIGVDTQLGPLADACVALRRTRELMSRHRKSVWWWQILLVLEAKAVEMALTAFAMHRTLDDGLAEEQQPLIGAWYAHLCEIVDHLGGQLGEELRLIGAPDPFQLARLAQSLPISRQLCTVIRTHRGGHSARWCLRFAERSERPLDEAVKAVTKLCLEQEPHDKNLDRNVVEYFQEAIPKSRFRKRWEAMRAPKRAGQRRR